MEQQGAELKSEGETFCPLCLNLLEEPVATPCGHNFCRKCLKAFRDEEQEYSVYSCPRCMKTFASRPLPTANTELATAMEQLKNPAAPADEAGDVTESGPGGVTESGPGGVVDAGPGNVTESGPGGVVESGPGDVACDVCTGRKRKALQSCLDCQSSYCELHLWPHQDIALLKKHQLVDLSKRQLQKTCHRHEDEELDMFCRTDQQGICHLCSADEHSGHNVVSAAEERVERQKELEGSRVCIQKGVREREELLEVLLPEMDAIRQSADKAVEEGEDVFSQLITLLEARREDLRRDVRRRQEEEVSRIKELCEKLQQDAVVLKRRDGVLRWISDTADHKQFLDHFASLPPLGKRADSPGVRLRSAAHFSAVTEVLSALQEKTEKALEEKCMELKWTVMDADMLLSEPQPKTRADFLKYSYYITLDEDTSSRHLAITDEGRKAERVHQKYYQWNSAERFTRSCQVLSKQAMTGRCYWEVHWEMKYSPIYIAVAYGDIKRDGYDSRFGSNDKSWALYCCDGWQVSFHHNGMKTQLPGFPSSKIGVYLDHRAGLLSFYNVSERMTRLYRAQTTFTQPLYAGINVGSSNIVTLKTPEK